MTRKSISGTADKSAISHNVRYGYDIRGPIHADSHMQPMDIDIVCPIGLSYQDLTKETADLQNL